MAHATVPIELPCRAHEVLATHTSALVFVHGRPHVHYNLAALRVAIDREGLDPNSVVYDASMAIADRCLNCDEPLNEELHLDDYCGNDCAIAHGRELLSLVGDLRMELRELRARTDRAGVLVTFADDDRSPDAATIEYLAGTSAPADLADAARALIYRAVDSTDPDDWHTLAVGRLAYSAVTGFLDLQLDDDTATAHAMKGAVALLSAHPTEPWNGPA